MNPLTEEAVLPTLHNLILAEVYLSGGPVDVFRLWSEMYERQKTIAVGTLLFVRAIAHLEENGFLQKVSESKSAITGKGEEYMASTGNILDVAPQGVAGVSGTVEGHARGALGHRSEVHKCACRDTRVSPSTEGLSRSPVSTQASPADSQDLDVANQGRGIAPSTESITVGDEGVSSNPKDVTEYRLSPTADSQIFDRHGDDRFADNILRALEGLPQNGDQEEEEAAAEEGALIEASNYPDPASDRSFA